jgi:hypothetical protein
MYPSPACQNTLARYAAYLLRSTFSLTFVAWLWRELEASASRHTTGRHIPWAGQDIAASQGQGQQPDAAIESSSLIISSFSTL